MLFGYLGTLLKDDSFIMIFSLQNPSKPHFNHYLFESLCLSIRVTCKANPDTVSSFEEALFPVFTEILQNDVQGALHYYKVVKLLNLFSHNCVVTFCLLGVLSVNLFLECVTKIHFNLIQI